MAKGNLKQFFPSLGVLDVNFTEEMEYAKSRNFLQAKLLTNQHSSLVIEFISICNVILSNKNRLQKGLFNFSKTDYLHFDQENIDRRATQPHGKKEKGVDLLSFYQSSAFKIGENNLIINLKSNNAFIKYSLFKKDWKEIKNSTDAIDCLVNVKDNIIRLVQAQEVKNIDVFNKEFIISQIQQTSLYYINQMAGDPKTESQPEPEYTI